jgi:Zn-dependent protease
LSLHLALVNLLPALPLDGSKLSRVGFPPLALGLSAYGVERWMNAASRLAARAIWRALA